MPKIPSLLISFLSVITTFPIASFKTKMLYEEGIPKSLKYQCPDERNGIITPVKKRMEERQKRDRD